MDLATTSVSKDALRKLSTPARSVVDPLDILVPDGYEVEVIIAGLSFPCGMGFTENGTLWR